jgi:hypothetical protein
MGKPHTPTRLVLCVLFAWAVGCCSAGVRKVVVGPAADQLSDNEVTISIKANDVVYWRSNDKRDLSIVFHKEAFPPQAQNEPPFILGTAGQDQGMSCKDGVCFSYDINPRLAAVFSHNSSLTELRYPYEQKLGSNGADGMIIIKP